MQRLAIAFYKLLQRPIGFKERDAPDGSSQVESIKESIADIAYTI